MPNARRTALLVAGFVLTTGHVHAQETAQVVVRIVDTDHIPVPNMKVDLREVSGCYRPDDAQRSTSVLSGDDGTAKFYISLHARYALIRTEWKDAGWEEQQRCVELSFSEIHRIAYVQLQLRGDPLHWAETVIPAKNAPRERELPVGTFAAPYQGTDGKTYVVTTMNTPGEGLALEVAPDETLWFPKRHGLTFSGPEGTLVFHVSGNRVLTFDLIRRQVSAKYVEPFK